MWTIESEPEYLAWLATIQAQHPRVTRPIKGLRPGDSIVGRTAVLAEDRDGVLYLGVQLNTKDEFWKPWAGSFRLLLDEQLAGGIVFERSKPVHTIDRIDPLIAEHGSVQRLEFCCSPEGSMVFAIMQDGHRVVVDEA